MTPEGVLYTSIMTSGVWLITFADMPNKGWLWLEIAGTKTLYIKSIVVSEELPILFP